jgi:copper homeostasis protein
MAVPNVLLEIAANSVASAVAAQGGGADRIELCAALEVGGLTPSPGQIALARERVRIPLYVLIRPRAGDFVYGEFEFETMRRDIESCVMLGCDGVVIGALDESGNIDRRSCAELVRTAGRLGVTFHRAFDMSRDLGKALEDIIALGCERVLTSGGEANALAGAPRIHALIEQAAGRIEMMPGAGIDVTNAATIRAQTGAIEFHASAKRQFPSRMAARDGAPRDMAAGEWRSDVGQVRAIINSLRAS